MYPHNLLQFFRLSYLINRKTPSRGWRVIRIKKEYCMIPDTRYLHCQKKETAWCYNTYSIVSHKCLWHPESDFVAVVQLVLLFASVPQSASPANTAIMLLRWPLKFLAVEEIVSCLQSYTVWCQDVVYAAVYIRNCVLKFAQPTIFSRGTIVLERLAVLVVQ